MVVKIEKISRSINPTGQNKAQGTNSRGMIDMKRQRDRQAGKQAGKQTDRQTHTKDGHRHIRTDRQIGREMDRQVPRAADRLKGREVGTQTASHAESIHRQTGGQGEVRQAGTHKRWAQAYTDRQADR